MITKRGHIICDECGRYINYEHLSNGTALHQLLTPDSDYTEEYFESLCRIHYKPNLTHSSNAPCLDNASK